MPLVIGEKELEQLPVNVDPEIVSGAPVFQGTRVPVEALINNLEAGLTLDEFLENFPTVTREQALLVFQVPIVAALVPDIEAALENIRIGDFIEIPYP